MLRYLTVALPLLLALISGGHFVLAALGWAPPGHLPVRTHFGGWLLEAVGLSALFLLVHARGLNRYVAGLGAAWTAWLFRGPVLVVTVAAASRMPVGDWWRLVFAWLALYTVCGWVLGALAPPVEAPKVTREPLPWPDEPSS